MAPLPLLLIDNSPGLRDYSWCFVLSCFTLFATVLWVRARDLPRLNLIAQLMLAPSLLFAFWCYAVHIIPVMAIIFALPAMLLARRYFPATCEADRPDPRWQDFVYRGTLTVFGLGATCGLVSGDPILAGFFLIVSGVSYYACDPTDRTAKSQSAPQVIVIFRSASVLYLALNLFAFLAIALCFKANRHPQLLFGWVGAIILVILAPVNLFWFATCPDEDLDLRPGLGFSYEFTLVLIPASVFFATLRALEWRYF